MDTLELVKNLLADYQVNLNKIKLADSQPVELNLSLKESLGIVKQQMQLLEFSMNCLSESEKSLIEMLFIKKISLSDAAKTLFTCKSNIFKRREKVVKHLAKIYEQLKNETIANENIVKVND